jgi:hypothetical protein
MHGASDRALSRVFSMHRFTSGGDFVNLMLRDSCSIEYANFIIATNRRFFFFSANIESAQK